MKGDAAAARVYAAARNLSELYASPSFTDVLKAVAPLAASREGRSLCVRTSESFTDEEFC